MAPEMDQAAQPTLSVENLNVAFGRAGARQPAVVDVSFTVDAGETVALVGGSGSGKSVTSMSLLQLLDPRQSAVTGRAMFQGQNLIGLPEAQMQKLRGNQIGMIFQEPMTSLNPVLTIGYQLSEALRKHRGLGRAAARAEALELLNRVRIPAAAKRLDEYPHRMSGGMRQRVMIAMAIACKPALLIADEPTTALDVTVQAEILDLLRNLQAEQGTSLLFITHDMGVVAEIADRTVVMHKGRIVEAAPTRDLFAAPREAYTRGLLGAVPRLGSMQGESLPRLFPTIDSATGDLIAPPPAQNTLQSGAPVVEVRNLSTRFNLESGLLRRVRERVHAVENVSLSLQAGETLALVGESGCGKSTLGRSIIRLTEPAEGQVILSGQEITQSAPKAWRSDVQMVFQDPFASLNPRRRVGESIADPLIINGMAKDQALLQARALLEKVGLEAHMANRFAHEFSGGQRQRICIARALALNPKLIIADEAVSALDAAVKTQVLNLMMNLQAELGVAFLFISHDMAVVERVAHRVAVMYLGEIVEIGPRAAIFDTPQHPYTKRLLASVPLPEPDRVRPPRATLREEIRTPVRAVGSVVAQRPLTDVAAGHFVQTFDPSAW